MQFTPQQLRGGQRYNTKIRIGNWKEEIVTDEYETNEFLRTAKKKGNNSTAIQKRIAKSTQIVSSSNYFSVSTS
jgi:hypothetical protein